MKEYVLDSLNEKKHSHSKMDNLIYTDLKIQDYLHDENTTTEQKRIIFLFRTRMADYHDNFREGKFPLPCRICGLHIDSQSHSVKCDQTTQNLKYKGNYNEIFLSNISKEMAIFLEKITEIRKPKEVNKSS